MNVMKINKSLTSRNTEVTKFRNYSNDHTYKRYPCIPKLLNSQNRSVLDWPQDAHGYDILLAKYQCQI